MSEIDTNALRAEMNAYLTTVTSGRGVWPAQRASDLCDALDKARADLEEAYKTVAGRILNEAYERQRAEKADMQIAAVRTAFSRLSSSLVASADLLDGEFSNAETSPWRLTILPRMNAVRVALDAQPE